MNITLWIILGLILLGVGVRIVVFKLQQAGGTRTTGAGDTRGFDAPLLPSDVLYETRALLDHGQKVAAVKRVREATNWPLKASKEYVDALASGGQRPAAPVARPPTSPLDQAPATLQDEVRALLARGQKIQAVKRVREVTGWGLKQAKNYADALED